MQAVVEKHGDAFVVMVAGANRGTFTQLADAQLWALTIATIEPDITHAVMACGTCIPK